MTFKRRVAYFLQGVGSLLNLAPPAAPRWRVPNPYSHATDADMLRRDWKAVGKDLWFGVKQVERELHERRR